MSSNDSAPCGIPECKKNVTKTTGGVQCGVLSVVNGFITTVKISPDEFNFLSKSKGKFLYECTECFGGASEVAELRDEMRSFSNSIQMKLDTLLANISNYDAQIKNLNEDVVNCGQLIKDVDENCSKQIKILEDKNEILQMGFNKSGIIINGLSRNVKKLKEVIF